MALSTKPYKGARDFYPEEKRFQTFMFSTWRRVVERFGYEEYDAPILEPLEIYLAKTGEEIVNEQTYVFEDRGGRKVVIRPEMTPTVSRMVAAKRQELAYPLRWYSIPNLWRYERPQRGRLREHWQLNVDIFGVEDTSAERELISLIDAIFKEFGASRDTYEIRLNHRKLVDYLLETYLGLDDKTSHAISKLIDKLNKMERTDFIKKVDSILTDDHKINNVTEKLLGILDAKSINDLPKSEQDQPAAKEITQLIQSLNNAGISNVTFDGTLVRGFDYYSGIVFEVFDTDPENNRSMLGGGRYDGLVGLFGANPAPTVGFGWGDVTLANFLESHNLLPKLKSPSQIFVIPVGDVDEVLQIVISELRTNNIAVAVGISNKKIGDQIKIAEKKGIEYVLIIGEDEVKQKKYTLKSLESGDEQKLTTKEIIQKLTNSK